MRLVIIESPYAGDIEENVEYARACVRDSLLRGEAPIASHLLHTQPGILRDGVPEERSLGIEAGHEWMRVADLIAVYIDMGTSKGMRWGIRHAEKLGKEVEYRTLRTRNEDSSSGPSDNLSQPIPGDLPPGGDAESS